MNGGGNLPVGPGIWGFVAFFVLAIALWFLVRNMNSRLRRMAYRDRDRAEELAAKADVDGTASGTAPGPTSGPGSAASGVPREHDDAPEEGPRP